jgi:hypothetical protein
VSRKSIRIACLGVPSDYRAGLVPLTIKNLGYQIDWVVPHRADLVVYGSFYDLNAPRLRWLPRSWRQGATSVVDAIEMQLAKRRIPPLTLFHTGENLRHDHIKADYSISHDLNILSDKHLRLAYWMEMIDWSHEGLMGNINPRYGQLLNLERLQSPLGNQFLMREQKGVLLSSHLREPRASALSALQKLIPVDGMGPYFDKQIKDHHSSDFLKKDILVRYAYNLCPENGLYPGYVTEKIPEAFSAGCLPITYVDQFVDVDFNPKAFINLAPMAESGYDGLAEILQSKSRLEAHAGEPLITQKPSLEPLTNFLKNIISNVL